MSMGEAAPAMPRLSHPAFDGSRRQAFVVGNEAADVDSLISAFAVAQLLDSEEVEGIALAQITREEFRLRGDALHLFGHCGGAELAADGSPRRLRFWDEVDWGAVRSLQGRTLVLTDHNTMTPKVGACFEPGQVRWVLDHHADQGLYPDAQRDLDESLGSACTLVQEQFAAAGRALSPQLGFMLLGVILLDSRNFDPEVGRGTARDRAAVDQLAMYMPEDGQDAFYARLTKARKDVSHLSAREQLMLDFKVAPVGGFEGSIAFCALFLTLDEIIGMVGGPSALIEIMQTFASEHGCQLVAVLSARDALGSKGFAVAPASAAEQAMLEAVVARLAGDTDHLPAELQANPLFIKQRIPQEGFGLQPRPELAPLQGFRMRVEITRKTLLPRAVTADGKREEAPEPNLSGKL